MYNDEKEEESSMNSPFFIMLALSIVSLVTWFGVALFGGG